MKNKTTSYNKVIYLDNYSRFLKWYNYSFASEEISREKSTTPPFLYRQLVTSPSGDMIAAVKLTVDTTYLVDPGGLHLITINGTNPFFSINGQEIFCVNGNVITRFPVTPGAIREILQKHHVKIPPSISLENKIKI